MKDFLFVKNHFLLNSLAAVSFGAWLGYNLRVEADSGLENQPDLYFQAAFACALSMLIAVVISHLLQNWFRLIPSFLLVGFLAPLFFGLAYRTSILVEGLGWASVSISDLREEFGASVVIAFIFGLIPFVIYLLVIRLVAYFGLVLYRVLAGSLYRSNS